LIGTKQEGAPTIVAMAGERKAGEKQASPASAELCARAGREALADNGMEVIGPTRHEFAAGADRAESRMNRVFGRLPMPVLRLAGRILYPHLS